jgi:hypothetical protein
MYSAAMNDCIMTDRHIVADNGFRSQEGGVDHGAILHVYLVSHPDAVHISTNHRIKPYTALVSGNHITNNSGVWRKKTMLTELR